jgi:hypothetical protein
MTSVLPRRHADARAEAPRYSTPVIVAGAVAIGMALSVSAPTKLLAIAAALYLAVRWPLERVLVAFVAISFAADERNTRPYAGLWKSPVQNIADFWFETIKKSVPFIPIPVSTMTLVALLMLVRAALRRTGPYLRIERPSYWLPPVLRISISVAFAVVFVFMVWGVARGGDVQQIYYQVFGPIVALCVLGATARVASPELVRSLIRVVLIVGVYRAFLVLWIYTTIVRHLNEEPPLYLTSHGDSLIWAVGVTYVISNFIESPSRQARKMFYFLLPLYSIAIVLNNRRLAWVVVFGAIAYIVFSASIHAKKRLAPVLVILVPIAALYTAAGLAAPPSKLFAPVQALESVATGNDRSSQTRGIEDFNLTYTMKANVPLPTGFGHEYIELVRADDISAGFEQYRYLPHNSVLGLMIYLGPIGLILMFLPMMLAMRSAHHLRVSTQNAVLRTDTAVIFCAWIGFVLQAWGDLGAFSALPVVLVGSFAGVGMGLSRYCETYGDDG